MRKRMINWKEMRATDLAKKYQFRYLTLSADGKYVVRNMWSSDRFNWSWYHIYSFDGEMFIVSNKIVEAGEFHLILKDGTLIWGTEVYPPETGMLEKFKSAYVNYLNHLGYVCEWDINAFKEEGYSEFEAISDKYKQEHPGVVYKLDI